MSTEQQRAEWRELTAARTPGVWEAERMQRQYVVSATAQVVAMTYPRINAHDDEPNAAFIAAASVAVPALLADVDRLTAERDALAAELARATAHARESEHLANMIAYENHDVIVRELKRQLDAVPRYVFACLKMRERGEMVIPSLIEWLGTELVHD